MMLNIGENVLVFEGINKSLIATKRQERVHAELSFQ